MNSTSSVFIRKFALSLLFLALGVPWMVPCHAETMQAMNNPTAVQLAPFKDPWPSAKLRWWDINNGPFDTFLNNLGQSEQFNYTAPTLNQYVRVTYDKAPATGYFKGYVEAKGLKPNFAYQIKLAGKPVKGKRGWGAYGDDLSNDRVGYVGRWWCDSSHVTQTNYDDSHYVNFYQNVSGSAVHDIYGYLFMGIFVTDEFGNANSNFNGRVSYHITRQSWQSGAKQKVAGTWNVQSLTAPYYGYGYKVDPVAVELWYEYENNMNATRPVIAALPAGDYNCRLMLTEETFHNNFGGGTNSTAGGFWQTVLASEDYTKDGNGNYLTDSSGNLLPDTNAANDIAFTIGVPPSITTQPVSKSICSGDAVSFTVAGTGTGPFAFQWRKGTSPLVNGGAIAGVDTDTLTINPATAANAVSNYNVVVTSYYGSATSNYASLTINTVAVTTQPANKVASTGSTIKFSVETTGSGLSYQWRRGSALLANGGNISGATSRILIISPVSASDVATDYNVVVTGPCNSATSNNARFALTTPIVGTFSPLGGAPGALVTINGNYLSGATAVRFNNMNAAFTVVSATKITTTVPSGALTGPISVTTPDGTASTATFTVAPRVSSFSPGSGTSGTLVTVNGANLGAANTTAKLNGVAASIYSRSATSLTFKVPNASSTGPIVLTNEGGTVATATNFVVLPKIISFTPTKANVGASITISGTALGAATQVQFNGTSVAPASVSATTVTVLVPVGATTGKITLVTPNGNAISATDFVVLP